jgi:VCBS repeat-containing protein
VPAATDLDGDVDANGYALVSNVGEGVLVFNADGSYTFDVGAAFQDLDASESRDVTFTYTATDDQGNVSAPATVTITVTGTDDTPIAQVHTDSAVEDGAAIAGNVPAATDLDGDVDASGYALVTSVGEGTLVFNADGSYTFNVGAAFQDLSATESRDVTFTYTATDDQSNMSAPATVTITVTGTNDAPTLTITDPSGTMSEGDGAAALSDSGSLSFGDFDTTDVVTVSETTNTAPMWSSGALSAPQIAALEAGFTVDANSWDYNTAENLDFLAAGETITMSFDVVAADDSGAGNNTSATQTVTVTITGTNDAPVAQGSSVTTLEDTQHVFTSAEFGFTDIESDDMSSITIQDLESLGSLRLNGVNVTEGTVITKAQLDNNELTFDAGPDESGVNYDNFTYTVNDASTGTVSAVMAINVTPVDDMNPIGPVTDVDAAVNRVASDASVGTVVGATAYATDPDLEDDVTYSLLDNAGGRFQIDASTGVITVASALDAGVATTYTVRDEFDAQSFSNSDGTADWSATPWVEANDSGSQDATGGNVQVTGAGVLRLDSSGGGAYESATRAVDLSDVIDITLSFDFEIPFNNIDTGDSMLLEISSDGGSTWTLLENFTGYGDAITGSRSIAVDPSFATADTQIRFAVGNGYSGGNEYFQVDNVQIEYTIDPSLGTHTVQVLATSDDLTTSTTSIDINVVNAADDVAVVHESALTEGSGRTETVFDNNDETGQDVSAGEPTKIATGNLTNNDSSATAVTSVDGNTADGSGVITVVGTHGTLVVTAATGAYTYTLTSAVDNSATADDLAATESFSYLNDNGDTANLDITIVDDTPQTGDFITNVPERQMSEFQLVFTLDISGSMTGAQYDGVVYLEDGSTTTRLEMAKDALKALVTEYYEQSDTVSVHLVTFSSTAQVLNGGAPYTDLASTLTAIDGMNGAGGTNYEDGLNKMQDALDSDNNGLLDVTGTNLQTITYFISDGVPTSGNTTNPVGASGWDTFLSDNAGDGNPIDSYAVGIGSGITDFSSLNAIHNVDADASGTADEAVYVPNVATLEEELLSTVPSAFGGSVVLSGAVQNVIFGADGGQIESLAVMLDLDNNGTPETNVTFTYDPNTDVISSGGVFSDISGSILPLDTASYEFVEGTLIFDFSTGNYNYYQSLAVSEGDSFTLTFVANDGDGDTTDPTTVTVQIVDGQPVANDDTDTLFPLGTELEGNVLSGIGTDGGVSNSSSFTTFSNQGVGVDNTVDNATVTSIVYRGDTIDLTSATTGTVTATAYAGTPEASTYDYSVDVSGTLTLANTTDGSTLSFNTQGHYLYTPSSVPSPPTASNIYDDFNNGVSGASGLIVSSPDGAVSFSGNGAGVGDNILNTGERLEIEFASTTHPYGVQNIQITAQSLGSSYEVFNVTAFHIDGHEMARTSIAGSATHTVFSGLSGIGHIEIQAGSNTSATVRAISFDPVQLDASAIAVAPEVIGYTITDEDIDPDSDSATLTLKVISNTLVDRLGSDSITGTSGNDFISGLGGDDVLDGGAGHDIVEGGVGDDDLIGGAGDDVLVGGEGVDELFGDAGNDNLSGGAGIDDLHGGDGDDELRGGEGGDNLFGNAGADTLYGDEGNDTLLGGDDNDNLSGGTGNDILTGGAGLDFLSGGTGSDVLTGGSGGPGDTESDVFTWGENDRGSLSSPDQDSITDFTVGAAGDVLDLSDLLQGEESNPLTDYLSISVGDFDTDGDIDTRIAVDSDGGIFFQPSLQITLEGVDLSAGGTLTDQDILNNLITDGNLDTDT